MDVDKELQSYFQHQFSFVEVFSANSVFLLLNIREVADSEDLDSLPTKP